MLTQKFVDFFNSLSISFYFQMLMDLGVERLVLPTVPSLLDYWSSVGFLKMTDSQRLQLLDYRFVEFENTIICQKSLMKIPLAEPCPSKNNLYALKMLS